MPEDLNVGYAIGLKPEEAIAYFEKKGYKLTWDWTEQVTLNNAIVFTAAKVAKMSILQDMRGMLQKALDDGLSYSEFKKELTPKLQAAGWWPEEIRDAKGRIVQQGAPQRLRTIYSTNMQGSYNTGRWKAFEDNMENRPFLKYIDAGDGNVRPTHRALNGQIHHINSSFWNAHAPPNGYNCRCRLRALSQTQVERAGGPSKRPEAEKTRPDEGFSQNLAKKQWKPDKKKYDKDIWNKVQPLKGD